MDKFELNADYEIEPGRVPRREKAVATLLTSPAVSYMRELRDYVDKDPNFLAFHSPSVGVRVRHLLSRQGVFLDENDYERQFVEILSEALDRLRKLEK